MGKNMTASEADMTRIGGLGGEDADWTLAGVDG
jgi:hypothetical protein